MPSVAERTSSLSPPPRSGVDGSREVLRNCDDTKPSIQEGNKIITPSAMAETSNTENAFVPSQQQHNHQIPAPGTITPVSQSYPDTLLWARLLQLEHKRIRTSIETVQKSCTQLSENLQGLTASLKLLREDMHLSQSNLNQSNKHVDTSIAAFRTDLVALKTGLMQGIERMAHMDKEQKVINASVEGDLEKSKMRSVVHEEELRTLARYTFQWAEDMRTRDDGEHAPGDGVDGDVLHSAANGAGSPRTASTTDD